MSDEDQLLPSAAAVEEARLRAELVALNFLVREVNKLRRSLSDLQLYLVGEIHLSHLEGAICGLWLGVRQVRVIDRWRETRGEAATVRDQLRLLILGCTELWGIEETVSPHGMLRHELRTQSEALAQTLSDLLGQLISQRRLLQRQIDEESRRER